MLKRLIVAVMLLASTTVYAGTSTIDVTAGFVVGPGEQAPSLYDFLIFNGFQSFTDNLVQVPSSTTLLESPSVYIPLASGSTVTTDHMIIRDDSWLAIDNPETSPVFGANANNFSSEEGCILWSFARVRANGDDLRLNMLRFDCVVSNGVLSSLVPSGSYETAEYIWSVTRTVLGIGYGGDGQFGGGDDVLYDASGSADTPVDEIWVIADFGISQDGLLYPGTGQAQLDSAVSNLNQFAPFSFTNTFFVEVGGNSVASSSSTINIDPAVVSGEGEGEGEGEIQNPHSADQDADGSISLPELLRVIQFFNLLSYSCNFVSEDGYAGGTSGTYDCEYHSSDYSPADWTIGLTELLRMIQFFNVGSYYECPSPPSEDGYCVGTP